MAIKDRIKIQDRPVLHNVIGFDLF